MITAIITGGLMAALVWAAWSLPAAAQAVHSLRGTTVTLQASPRHGAAAEIVLDNREVNSGSDEATFTLTLDGLTVGVAFDWDQGADGADAVLVTPPEGYMCYPASCVLSVAERHVGTLWIFSREAVGM